ncbi:MAG TPA: OmpA family protein [Methylomirabilota bacterium]|nr:OmpA family protein [Methylomirabilota bacterium]
MNVSGLPVIAIAALASSLIGTGCASRPALAQVRAFPLTEAAVPRAFVLAQADPAPIARPSAASAPAAPVVPPPAPKTPIGLPRVSEYQAILELRDIYFDFGKAVIRPDDARVLDANAAWLRAHPDHLVLIEGYSDNRGLTTNKNEFNLALGEQRAQAAMNHLIARGVQPNRITILSYGEERPRCAEQSETCWSQNRRSRFLVKPR